MFLTGPGFNREAVDGGLQADGKLVVGGKFTTIVGFPVGRIARLDASGHIDFSFNPNGTGANGDIMTVKVLADGKILIGGSFTNYNGTNVNNFARLNADGTLDPTFNSGTGANSSVHQIVLQPNNKILITGGFSTYNGFATRVARLEYDGTVDQSFSFMPTNFGYNDVLRALAVQADGKVLIGGNFFGGDTVELSNIARINANGSLDTSFQVKATGSSAAGAPVWSIVVRPDGKILVGGQFMTVNSVSKFGIALLNANGTLDNSFTSTTVNQVRKLTLLPDGRIAVGGNVQIPGQSSSKVIGLLNANGTADASFQPLEVHFPSVGNQPILTPDSKILICGLMSNNTPQIVPGANPAGVRRLNLDGTRDLTYHTRTGAASGIMGRPIIQSTGKIVFNVGEGKVGGLARTSLARLNADGTVDENYAPSLRGTSITNMPDDSVLIGGVLDSQGRHLIRKFNPDGTLNPDFSVELTVLPNSSSSGVLDMATQSDGKVIVVGNFATVGGVARKSIARLNPDGSIDTSFNHNLTFNEATVWRVVIQPDGKIWVSGSFGSTQATFRLNSSGTAEIFVQAMASDISPLPDGKAYIAGGFTTVGQTPVKYVARLNQDGTVDSTFTPADIGTSGVIAIYAQPNGKVLIGGSFLTVGGASRRNFARLNANGSLDTSFTTMTNQPSGGAGGITGITRQPDGKIVLSGTLLSTVNNIEVQNFARLLPLTKPGVFDFDGDAKTDLSIFRSSVGEWWINRSSSAQTVAAQFGAASDKPVPADFSGDGKTDIAFWRPSTGEWFILRSEDGSFYSVPFGAAGDIPVAADFDGDTKADTAVFRPSSATWFISKSTGGTAILTFGASGDIPVAGDYDGDQKTDIAIYRPLTGEWWIQRSSNLSVYAFQFGAASDKPVQGDYSGDGKTDTAFFRPSTGEWFILRSEDSSFYSVPFGATGDVPVPGDYDGDGKFDTAIFRPADTNWYIQRSTAGLLIQQFGANGDKPLPNSFIP